MRDPNRIQRILYLINHIWQAAPDQRFTQLLYNVLGVGPHDIYYKDDDELESKLKEVYNQLNEHGTSQMWYKPSIE